MKYCLFFNNREQLETMTSDLMYVLLKDWEG